MQNFFDPFAYFRELYDKTEESSTKYWESVMGTENFAVMANRLLEGYLKQYSTANSALDQAMKNLKLPTQDDIARLANLIVAVEDKVDQLEEAIEGINDLLGKALAADAMKKAGRNKLSETTGK